MESTSPKRAKLSGRKQRDSDSHSHEPSRSSQHHGRSGGGRRHKKKNRTKATANEESADGHQEYPERSSAGFQLQPATSDMTEPDDIVYSPSSTAMDNWQNSSPPSNGSVAAYQGSGEDSNSPTSGEGFDTVATNNASRGAVQNTNLSDYPADFADFRNTNQSQIVHSGNSQSPWNHLTPHNQHNSHEMQDFLWSIDDLLSDATNSRTH